jgi:hypothetical protein
LDAASTAQPDAQPLVDYAQSIITGEELMFIMEVPPAPPQETPIVLAQTGATTGTTPQPDYILRDCQKTEHSADPRSAVRSVDPAGALKDFIQGRDDRDIDLALFKPSLLQGPQHGKITEGVDNLGFTSYRYDPEPEFFGDDQAIFMVEFEGKRYKVIYQIKVVEYVEDNTTCPPPKLIKVTKPSSGFNGYDLNSVTVSIADLPGAVIGQTTGSNITLDTKASGYGWFIALPWDNRTCRAG